MSACLPAVACARDYRATREPVGVSNGGVIDHEQEAGVSNAPPLADLPADFRTTWNKIGAHVQSEHGRFTADVYEHDHAHYAEDLFLEDAGAGIYVIDRADAGVRYAIADSRGRTVADGDAGVLEVCARCHANARDVVYPIVP